MVLGVLRGLRLFGVGCFFSLVGLGFFVRFGFVSFFLLTGADQKTATLFCGSYKT